jgi:AcrR family transcriptional regulator
MAMVGTAAKPATRDLILDATDRLMGRYGFRKMTMDDVAKEAGVSKRTIYVYFATKEDLGLSFLRRLVEGIQGELAQIIASDRDPAEKLSAVLTHRILPRVVGLKDYAQCLDEIFDGVRPRYLAQRQGFFETERQMVIGILEEGCRAGCFSVEDPAQCAKALLLATNALLPYSLSIKEMGGLETIENDLLTVVSLLVSGLRGGAN